MRCSAAAWFAFLPNNDFTTGGTPQSEMKPAFAYGFGTDFKIKTTGPFACSIAVCCAVIPDFKLSTASHHLGPG